jgi:3-dehydrosphinganine reductase
MGWVAGLYTVTGYGGYLPSKAVIKSLSDTLAQGILLYRDDIKIYIVLPSRIASREMETKNKTKPKVPRILEEMDPI